MKKVIIIIFFIQSVCFSQLVQQEWVASYNGPDNLGFNILAMAMDSTRNIIVTGYTTRSYSWQDYCTIKYNSSGLQQWIALYGGPGNQNVSWPAAIGVDLQGNIYVTGKSGNISAMDYCTIKYSSDGVQQWVERYNNNGGGDNEASVLTIDPSGNCIVSGYSYGSNYSATIKYSSNGDSLWVAKNTSFNSVSITSDNQGYSYITGGSAAIKYNSQGVQQWITNISGNRITLDNQNNVYTVGMYFVGTNSTFRTVRYNNSGVQQWAQVFPGSASYARPYGIAVDKNYNVYVSGYFYNGSADYDYLTIKYNSSGVQQWVQIYNGPTNQGDAAKSLALDDSANIYITGESLGTSGNEICTIKYNSSGSQQWLIRYISDGNAGGEAILTDRYRNVYVSGGLGIGIGSGVIKYSQPIGINKISGEIPDKFSLSQNYPNPFNPSTKIKFNIASNVKREMSNLPDGKAGVKLIIYDLLSREVATLVNESLQPGTYEVEFDASYFASGIYFYKLYITDPETSSGLNFTETKKMVLIK